MFVIAPNPGANKYRTDRDLNMHNKHIAMNQCWLNVVPALLTVDQHWTCIG